MGPPGAHRPGRARWADERDEINQLRREVKPNIERELLKRVVEFRVKDPADLVGTNERSSAFLFASHPVSWVMEDV
jgi:hypothetical protein